MENGHTLLPSLFTPSLLARSSPLTIAGRDPITALTLNNLGTLLKMEELYDEGEQCYREALKIRQSAIHSFLSLI
jgi:hypothetical protein